MTEGVCVACHSEFEPSNTRQVRCRECIVEDRRARKNPVPRRTETDVEEALRVLQEAGHTVSLDVERPVVRLGKKGTRRFRIGAYGDTHLGSKYANETALDDVAQEFRAAGVEAVLHAGDLVHGSHKMHRDMLYECIHHGATQQLEYATYILPKFDCPHYLIDGNHDLSFVKDGGVQIGKEFAARRRDVTYLGSEHGSFVVGTEACRIQLWHPRGGGAKVRGALAQRWVDATPAHERPAILMHGHLHTPAHLPQYKGVECFSLPCFQRRTPFEASFNLEPVVGALILDVLVDSLGVTSVTTRWLVYR